MKLVDLPWSDPQYGAYQLPEAQAKALLAANAAFKAKYGRDIRLISAFRGAARNAAAGGAPNSEHTHGNAIDISMEDVEKALPFLKQFGWNQLGGTYKNPKTGKVQSEANHFYFGAPHSGVSKPSPMQMVQSFDPNLVNAIDPEGLFPELRQAPVKSTYTPPVIPQTNYKPVLVDQSTVNSILGQANTTPRGVAKQDTNFFGDVGNAFLNQASFNTLNNPTGGGVGSVIGAGAGGIANVLSVAGAAALAGVAPQVAAPLALGLGGALGQGSAEARQQLNAKGQITDPGAVALQGGIGLVTNLIPAAKGGSLASRLVKDAAIGGVGAGVGDVASQVSRGQQFSPQELINSVVLGMGMNAAGQFIPDKSVAAPQKRVELGVPNQKYTPEQVYQGRNEAARQILAARNAVENPTAPLPDAVQSKLADMSATNNLLQKQLTGEDVTPIIQARNTLQDNMTTPPNKAGLVDLEAKLQQDLQAIPKNPMTTMTKDGPTPEPGTLGQILEPKVPMDATVVSTKAEANAIAKKMRIDEGLTPDEIQITQRGSSFTVERLPMNTQGLADEMRTAALVQSYKEALQQPGAVPKVLYKRLMKERATPPPEPTPIVTPDPPTQVQPDPIQTQQPLEQPQNIVQDTQAVNPETNPSTVPQAAFRERPSALSVDELKNNFPNEVAKISPQKQPLLDSLSNAIQNGTPVTYGYQAGIGRTSRFDTARMVPTHFEISGGTVKVAGFNEFGQPVTHYIDNFNPSNKTPTGRNTKVGSANYRESSGITTSVEPYKGQFNTEPPPGYVRPVKVPESQRVQAREAATSYALSSTMYPELRQKFKSFQKIFEKKSLGVDEFNRTKQNMEAVLQKAKSEGKLQQILDTISDSTGRC